MRARPACHSGCWLTVVISLVAVAGQDDFLEPRTAAALLAILAGPGHGCPRFARQCRALL